MTGAGAGARNSIGLVLVGGMAIGTLFVLLAREHAAESAGRDPMPAPAG